MGAREYLTKPFDIETLLKILDELLEESKLGKITKPNSS